MNIGSLEFEFLANVAKLRQDMEDAKKAVGGASEFMAAAWDGAKKAFAGFLTLAAANSFKNMVMGIIDATGALHDLSQVTGNSVAALAQFKSIGAYSETSLESIAAASLKLSKNLASTTEDGKGAAAALKAMGLDFDTFVKMNPDQRMLAAAKALSQYEDGADKSAAAMLLFGKEGAKMLPFLADLADKADEVTAKLTEQEIQTKKLQAAMADAFGDNLTKIRKDSDAWKKDLSLGLLPALYEMTEAFMQVEKGGGGIKAKISELAKDGTLAEWARMGATALSYLIDVGQALFSLLPMIGKAIAAVLSAGMELFSNMGDAVDKVMKGDFSGALDSMKNGFRSVQTIGTDAAEDISKIWNQKLIGESFRDAMEGLKGVQVAAGDAKKKMDLSDVLAKNAAAKKAEAAAAKAAADEEKRLLALYEQHFKAGQTLIASTKLKNEQLQQELDLGRKLTPVEQEQLKLTIALADGTVVMTKEEEKATRALIEHSAAIEKDIAWMYQSRKENEAHITATDKRIEQLKDETDKLRISNSEMLLSTKQLGAMRVARLEDAAAVADETAKVMDLVDWSGQLGDQQRELAKAYRERAAVEAEGTAVKAAKEAQEAWQKVNDTISQGLTDSLFRAFESGKGFFKTLWDGIVNTFKTTALKLIISGSDGNGGIVGTVMNAIGLGSKAGGSSSGSSIGSLGSWGSMASSVYGWLGGGSAAAGAGFGTVAYSNLVGAAGGDSLGALIGANAGNWGVSVGAGAAGSGSAAGAGAGAGASASTSWIPIVGAIIAGIFTSASMYDKGYSADKTNWAEDLFAGGGQKLNTNIWSGIVGDKWANALTGASLGNKLINWGAGTPHRGAQYISTGVGVGYEPTEDNATGAMAGGASIHENHSAAVADALKTLTGGSAGLLNEFAKQFGQAQNFKVGGYWSADNHDASQGNIMIWKDGKNIATSPDGHYASNPEQGFTEYAADMAKYVRQALDTISLPDWATKIMKGLGANATFDEMGKFLDNLLAFQKAVGDMSKSFEPLGGIFGDIAKASMGAKVSLIDLAGGLDKLQALSAQYVSDYFSKEEQLGLQAKAMQEALQKLGVDGNTLASREDFRALVDSLGTKLENVDAQKQLVGLLQLGPQFTALADYMKENSLNLAEVADAAPQVKALEALTGKQDEATAVQAKIADGQEETNGLLGNIFDTISAGNDAIVTGLSSVTTALERVGDAMVESQGRPIVGADA